MSERFDAVVCGGGPSGSLAAVVLARAGWRVAVVDRGGTGGAVEGQSLPSAAGPILRDVGLLSLLRHSKHPPCAGNVAIWGGEIPTESDFIRDPNGSGWRIDRRVFDKDLRSSAVAAGAVLWRNHRVVGLRSEQEGWQLEVVSDAEVRSVRSRWLIDASGRRGLGLAGAPLRTDRLVAGVAAFNAAKNDHDARSWVEASANGWWYTALTSDRRRVLAWFTDSDLVRSLRDRSANGLLDHARKATCIRGSFDWSGGAVAMLRWHPAHTVSRTTYFGDRWLSVGDATLAFDPLSSQGMFHALYTGVRGAQAVLEADRGLSHALEEYQDRIRQIEVVYRRNLKHYYGLERRWSDATFWLRRAGRS